MTKTTQEPRIPPMARPKKEPLTKKQQTYLALLEHWWAYRKRPPALRELADLIRPKKSYTAIRNALMAAEVKGYCRRNQHGQFEVTP